MVTWELLEISGGTKLTLTHEGIETFPKDNPIFTREACQEGWTYFVNERLKEFLQRQAS